MSKRLGGIGEAFADRNFRIYSIGSVTSWITYFVQEIAFSWTAWEVTKSTAWLAVVAGLTTLATILFIPVGGVFADRYDRFTMVRIAYGFDLVKAMILAILAATNSITLSIICAAAFAHGLIHSFSIPASYGMMPRFVAKDRLASCIAVSAAYTQFAVFAGPALAGWLLVHWGIAVAFLTNVLGYILYFVTTLFLVTPDGYQQDRAPRQSIRQDILVGISYVASHRGLSALLLLILAGDSVSSALYRLMPAYSSTVLAGGAGTMSALYGAAGLGATLAALWLAHGGAAGATPGRVLWALLGLAVSALLLAGSITLAMALLAMLLFGFSQETRRTGTVSIMQASVQDSQRGRVLSSLFLFTQVAGGLGTIIVGTSAQATGLRLPMLVSGLLVAVVWFITFGRRETIAASFARKSGRNQ
ncbi:putative MFS family arabinose efflux permease [Roseiarcus fermentans]|uniref:Putative MFS family arabinose efflux permease n=2 Tax=Roseiarcus fermentans TaxID=1473586 RepID=A0A366ESY5_9HYPH|nr:putative MFS family arabinose efflux permease [Roseiarcus fermentans]